MICQNHLNLKVVAIVMIKEAHKNEKVPLTLALYKRLRALAIYGLPLQ